MKNTGKLHGINCVIKVRGLSRLTRRLAQTLEPISFAIRSRNLFCKIMQASAKPCRVFSLFFLGVFSCFFFLFFVFTPTEFTVAELCDDNAGTGLITFSTVSKKEMVWKQYLPYTQMQCQTEDKQTES